jgi:hypothetical protein
VTTEPTAALYPCPRSRSVGPLRTLRPDPDLGRHGPRGEPFGRASRPSRPGRRTARAAIGPLARGGHRGLPALARPGSAQVQVPDFWQPEGVSGQAGPAGPAITMVAECSLMPMSGRLNRYVIALPCDSRFRLRQLIQLHQRSHQYQFPRGQC